MKSYIRVIRLCLIALLLIFISCSSSKKVSSSSSTFDASEYYNPHYSPNDLQATIDQKLNNPDQPSGKVSFTPKNFTPAKITWERLELSVTRKPTVPPQFKSFSAGGGQTDLRLYIDENGNLQKIKRMGTSDDQFESALIESLEKASFEPATLNGKAVKSVMRISFAY